MASVALGCRAALPVRATARLSARRPTAAMAAPLAPSRAALVSQPLVRDRRGGGPWAPNRGPMGLGVCRWGAVGGMCGGGASHQQLAG